MPYTKAQLEARVQTLSEVLEAFDIERFIGPSQAWTEWTSDYRKSLYNRLVAARKALAEVEEKEEASPYAPSEAYLNALRSFGLTDEQCVEELRRARDCDFDLLLADKVRKAYDQGKAEGYQDGLNKGWEQGYHAARIKAIARLLKGKE